MFQQFRKARKNWYWSVIYQWDTFAIFKFSGNILCCNETLKIYSKEVTNTLISEVSFAILEEILSYPEILLGFKLGQASFSSSPVRFPSPMKFRCRFWCWWNCVCDSGIIEASFDKFRLSKRDLNLVYKRFLFVDFFFWKSFV